MSQSDIMEFLDKYPNRMFSPREIKELIGMEITIASVYQSLKKIVKRDEYYMTLAYKTTNGTKQGRANEYLVSVYGKR